VEGGQARLVGGGLVAAGAVPEHVGEHARTLSRRSRDVNRDVTPVTLERRA
jgi:hypothetical protein